MSLSWLSIRHQYEQSTTGQSNIHLPIFTRDQNCRQFERELTSFVLCLHDYWKSSTSAELTNFRKLAFFYPQRRIFFVVESCPSSSPRGKQRTSLHLSLMFHSPAGPNLPVPPWPVGALSPPTMDEIAAATIDRKLGSDVSTWVRVSVRDF